MFSLRLQPVLSFSVNRSRGSASSADRSARWLWPMRPSRSLRAPLRVRGPLPPGPLPLSLEIPGIVVDTKHLLQDKYLLADACVCSRALQEPGHELVAALRGLTKCIN